MAIYSDLNSRYGIDSNKLIITDHDAVKHSLDSMFKYTNKSRFMRPNFVSKLWILLYRTISTDTAFDILQAIQDMVAEREPRIRINMKKTMIVADRSNKQYLVTLGYTLIEDGSEDNFNTTLQGAG